MADKKTPKLDKFKPIDYFKPYSSGGSVSAQQPVRRFVPARQSIGRLERTPKRPVITYVPGKGSQVSVKGMDDSRYLTDDQAVDVAMWSQLRRDVDRRLGTHRAGKPVQDIRPKITVEGKPYDSLEEAAEAADQASRNRRDRGKVASALARLGITHTFVSKDGEPIGADDKKALAKILADPERVPSMSTIKGQYGQLFKNRKDYSDQYMTWEKKKIADAKAAAQGRADVRSAEGVPAGAPGVAIGPGGAPGHAAPQGYWDGWKPTSASRGKAGDAMHYHTRDDSWRHNVSNTQGGAAAVRDRIDKSTWEWSADGRRARVQNRLVDAMNSYNDQQMNVLAGQVEALTELSRHGIVPDVPAETGEEST